MREALADLGSGLKDAVILGMGNELSGDDGVGPYVAKELMASVGIRAVDVGMLPENFTSKIAGMRPSAIIIVDAAYFEGEPGTIRIVDPDTVDQVIFTTHHIPLSYTVQRLEAMTGASVLIIGIRPDSLEMGQPLSPRVREAADALVSAIAELDASIRDAGCQH